MPKRRTHDTYDSNDNPIGLTGAFAPVKGPQSVDYDTNDDPVGLTQAFGAIPDQDEPHAWDEDGKWNGFDWNSSGSEPVEHISADDAAGSGAESDGAKAASSAPEVEPIAAPAATSSSSTGPKHGRHVAKEPELSPRMQKSRRTRKVLIVLVILLIVVIGAVAFFGYRTVTGSQKEAAQQTQNQATTNQLNNIVDTSNNDATDSSAKQADVPNLAQYLGMNQDQVIADLGRGALVTSNHAVNEEGNPIKANLNVALTEEPADSKTGTPTVYLGVAEDGTVRQIGYSASASALGFGSLSFSDAVNNEHVIEKTLGRIGVSVPEGTVVLPADKNTYSTYASDGTTVVRERCSFEGDTDVAGKPCVWSSVLSYDYTTQVVTGNLNDTVRVIYVYATMK